MGNFYRHITVANLDASATLRDSDKTVVADSRLQAKLTEVLSPLSELPDHVAAVGPSAFQWLPSCLPKNMDEWEQERLLSLQMKGEIKRLRYQLQKAEGKSSSSNARAWLCVGIAVSYEQ